MIQEDFGGVKVDVCDRGCRGIWFDWFELSKLDEKNEGFGQALEKALQHPRCNEGERDNINCPKCGIPMHFHKYQSSKEVNVDECYGCGGFFLDSGEFKGIRETFMSREEEEDYFQKLLNGVPEFQEARENQGKAALRAEALRRYTRFLRLSYYVNGR
jgi:hypothetical protein